jgi:hypothetical protein
MVRLLQASMSTIDGIKIRLIEKARLCHVLARKRYKYEFRYRLFVHELTEKLKNCNIPDCCGCSFLLCLKDIEDIHNCKRCKRLRKSELKLRLF